MMVLLLSTSNQPLTGTCCRVGSSETKVEVGLLKGYNTCRNQHTTADCLMILTIGCPMQLLNQLIKPVT